MVGKKLPNSEFENHFGDIVAVSRSEDTLVDNLFEICDFKCIYKRNTTFINLQGGQKYIYSCSYGK